MTKNWQEGKKIITFYRCLLIIHGSEKKGLLFTITGKWDYSAIFQEIGRDILHKSDSICWHSGGFFPYGLAIWVLC